MKKSRVEIVAMQHYVQRRGSRWAMTLGDCLLLAMFGNDEQRFFCQFCLRLRSVFRS